MAKMFLEAGEFVSTHGIIGELKLYPWADDADFFVPFKRFFLSADGHKEIKAERVRSHKNMCIVKLDGVDTVEQARSYIGKTVWIARADAELEDGCVFVQDLLGLKVIDAETNEEYGTVKNVTRPGRHDIYEIVNAAGDVFYFPAVEAFLKEIDLEQAKVVVSPIPGIFDAPSEKPKQVKRKPRNPRHSGEKQGEEKQ